MKKIVKYPLKKSLNVQEIEMVDNSQVVAVGNDPSTGWISIWATHRNIDEDEGRVTKKFQILESIAKLGDMTTYLGPVEWREPGNLDNLANFHVVELPGE